MAAYTLVPLARWGITPASGMKLYTYAAGTSTPIFAYQTDTGTTHANPIEANAAGLFAAIYIPVGTSYKFICKTSADVTIWTQDGIGSVPSSAVAQDVTGTFGESVTAEQAVYLSDGSGSLNAGQWYKADSDLTYASSDAGSVGLALADVTAAMTGSIRIGGQMDIQASSLSVGSKYYVSATAGGMTTTEPVNSRFLGVADAVDSIILAPNPLQSGAGLNLVQIWAFGG